MTDQEKEALKQQVRVLGNTIVLLESEGLYKGKFRLALEEGIQLLGAIKAQAEKTLNETQLILPPTPKLEVVPAGAVTTVK